MDLTKIVEAIIANGDKIGIGVVCLFICFLFWQGLRSFSKFLDRTMDKDEKSFELTSKAISLGDKMAEATDAMKVTAESVTASNESQNTLFERFGADFNNLATSLTAALGQQVTAISGQLTNTQTAIIDALNSRDLASLRKGVLVINPEGRITSCNKDALAILGAKAEDIINSTLADRIGWFMFSDGSAVPPGEIPTVFALQTAMPSRQNLLGVKRTADSAVIWLLIDAEPVVSLENHKVTRVIVTFRDVGDFILNKTSTSEMSKVESTS
jgi:PAS domain-containing protein